MSERGVALFAVVVAAGVVAAARTDSSEPQPGRVIYEQRCAACHGTGGAGDGPAAAAMEPRPRDLRDADFWRGRTTAELRQVVRNGKPGTLMAPFAGALSDAEIDAVVAFLQSFRPAGH